MKRFKAILAIIMLAVVLAAAAAVVYAPVEAYAEEGAAYSYFISVAGTDFTGIRKSAAADNSYVLSNGNDHIKLCCETDGHLEHISSVDLKFYYGDTCVYDITNISMGTGSTSMTVYDQDNLSTYKSKIQSKGLTPPEKMRLTLTDVAADTTTHAVVTFLFTDADNEQAVSSSASAASSHTHTWEYGTIYAATEDADGLEGYYCSCGATKEISVIPSVTAIYKNRYTQMEAASKGAVITLKMGTWSTLTKDFMKHVLAASQRGVTIRLDYKYDKKNYVTTIPAGTTMDLAYDYYGPLFIQSIFGAEKLN